MCYGTNGSFERTTRNCTGVAKILADAREFGVGCSSAPQAVEQYLLGFDRVWLDTEEEEHGDEVIQHLDRGGSAWLFPAKVGRFAGPSLRLATFI